MRQIARHPVIVGIDGSPDAEYAARWAVDDAVGYGVPLVLVAVIRTDLRGTLTSPEYRAEVARAKSSLQSAHRLRGLV